MRSTTRETARARGIAVLTAGEALVGTKADAAFGLIIWAFTTDRATTERAAPRGRLGGVALLR